MAELFAIVVWWILVALIGIAGGSLAAVLGIGTLTAFIGAIALLAGGVFVGGSVLANNLSLLRRSVVSDNHSDLAGAGLLRATLLGFLGAGLIVGSLNGNGLVAIVATVTAVVAVLLMATGGSIRGRTRT